MPCIKLDAMRQDIERGAPAKIAGPVLFAKGALYGYCPRCAAPGIRRRAGKDLCQGGHEYPSMQAKDTPH